MPMQVIVLPLLEFGAGTLAPGGLHGAKGVRRETENPTEERRREAWKPNPTD